MALIVITINDTPDGPAVGMVAEPQLDGPMARPTPAQQIARAMLGVLTPPEPSVVVPDNKIITFS